MNSDDRQLDPRFDPLIDLLANASARLAAKALELAQSDRLPFDEGLVCMDALHILADRLACAEHVLRERLADEHYESIRSVLENTEGH